MHAVGLPELIALDEDDYFAVALTLASDAGLLAACKAKLRGNRLTTPLFDVASYTAAIERLFETMWERRRSGAVRSAIWA